MTNEHERMRELYRRIRRGGDNEQRLLAALAPILSRAAARRFDLRPASTANAGRVASALWSAASVETKGCVFIPACVPLPDAPTRDDLRVHGLATGLRAAHDAPLSAALRPMTASQLEFAVEREIGAALRSAIASTASSCGGTVVDSARDVVQYAVAACVGYAASNDDRAMRGIEPLVALLSDVIPLLPKREGSRTWIALSGC